MMVREICRTCGGMMTWVPNGQRYYCYRCRAYPPVCPTCSKDLFWVPENSKYFCNVCAKYPGDHPVSPAPMPVTSPPPAPVVPLGAPLLPKPLTVPELEKVPIKRFTPNEVVKMVGQLQDMLNGGLLDEETYLSGIQDLKFRDKNGIYWSLGYRSKKWYSFVGERWVEGTPPEMLEK